MAALPSAQRSPGLRTPRVAEQIVPGAEDPTLPTPSNERLWLAYLSGAFGLAATAQINFLVPLRARELGASFEVIGLIVGAGAAVPAILSVTTGAAIDRLGSRRAFLLGTVSTGILSAIGLLVTNYWWLLALQSVLGIARNLGWLASQTYITGVGPEDLRQRTASRFAFFTSSGQMAAPAMMGAVAQFTGYRSAFLFLAAYAFAFSLVGARLPRVPHEDAPRPATATTFGLRAALHLLGNRPIQVVLLLSGLRLWITWVYTAFIPVYLVDRGLPPALVGTVLATYGVLGAISTPTTEFWTRFLSPVRVAMLAMVAGAVGLLLAPHLVAVPVVYLVPALIGISQGLSLPVILTIMGGSAPPGQRGVALGLRSAVNQTTAAAGPVLVGTLISALGVVTGFTIGGLFAGGIVLGAHALDMRREVEDTRID